MPPFYLALHFSLCVLIVLAVRRWVTSPKNGLMVALFALTIMIVGFAIERNPMWAWNSMRLLGSGWVFLTNVSLETVCTLTVVLWKLAADTKAKRRAVLYSIPLLGAALWSYAWYFSPLPEGLTGNVDKTGYCAQTTDDSCSNCAAAMLLAKHGISSNEREMAELSLTRAGLGTPPLGLYRGLWLKTQGHNLRPKLVRVSSPGELASLGDASIIAVGLKKSAPIEIQRKMIEYGWQPGQRHAVVVMKANPKGKWLDIADPTFGRERWPTKDIEYLWDGQALYLAPQ